MKKYTFILIVVTVIFFGAGCIKKENAPLTVNTDAEPSVQVPASFS